MGRYRQAPAGFECPYKDACPHLGMSTTWTPLLLGDLERAEMRYLQALREAEARAEAAEARNETLLGRVAELEARLGQQHRSRFKPNAGKRPAAAPAAREPPPRKRGAPFGHPPWRRAEPTHEDECVRVAAPRVCPHCRHEALEPTGKESVQVQEDIVLQPRTRVVRYVHGTAWCPHCRRDVFETAPGELRNCAIGPVAKAAAVYLRHEAKLSHRDVRKVFAEIFGLRFVPASAMAFGHRAAAQGAVLYDDLRETVRCEPFVHADETHWRRDGKAGHIWYAGNERVAYYHADASRSSDVAVSILGANFPGGLVADGYAGYNAVHPKGRQACLAHLSRTAKEIAERIALMPVDRRDSASLRFCGKLREFFSICCRIDQRRRDRTLAFEAARAYKPVLRRVLDELCGAVMGNAEAENLRQRLTDPKRDAPNLFTYLDFEGMPPTNNHAEQSLRLPVIFRKITFGSRSDEGAQALAVNLSLLTTAKRNGQDPLAMFASVHRHGADTPATALYGAGNNTT